MDDNELLETNKAPTSRKKYVGIEIEFLLGRDRFEEFKKLLIENELQWYCNMGRDRSVEDLDFVPIIKMTPSTWRHGVMDSITVNINEKRCGSEIRILAPEDEAPKIIRKVCEIIVQCAGSVNKTCGLHVHVDLRSRDYDTVYNNMFMVQDLMFKTQPTSRTTRNRFCKKLRAMQGPKSVAGRYYAINRRAYKTHRTIEIRLHEPTLISKEIIMWMKFLINIANVETKLNKTISTVEQLPWLPESLKGYLNERIKKYSRKSNSKTA